ncbi:MAG: Chemotaxis protein methyltransferase Cher2 [Alphaproteobacteria bacterium MarineAlpha3_Bin1]|nr:MAG: Chemotaxis protein methyltransferase Cher2 [Alphaproteobacteria bacterium MarineAlpha3_Bin1]
MRLTQNEYSFIQQLVEERSGIVLDNGKQTMVEQHLKPVCEENGIQELAALIHELKMSPHSRFHNLVVESVTTHETGFFRDMPAFKALKTEVLPGLLAKRQADRTLNLWSAGCSSGQEPYSVALLLQDNFPELRDWTVRFVATDISPKILKRAREGKYNQLEVNRGLPAPMLLKNFSKAGLEWQLRPEIRSRVEFRELNLIDPWPPFPKMDIIFLRNVLVYFQSEAKRAILAKIAEQLRPDGFMFMGTAEMPMTADNVFKKMDIPRAGCFRKRETT